MTGQQGPIARSAARRPLRLAAGLWAVVGAVVWNGIYDLGISLGVSDYLAHAALYDAGRAPYIPLSDAMDETVMSAVRLATFWTALVLAAASGTVRLLGGARS